MLPPPSPTPPGAHHRITARGTPRKKVGHMYTRDTLLIVIHTYIHISSKILQSDAVFTGKKIKNPPPALDHKTVDTMALPFRYSLPHVGNLVLFVSTGFHRPPAYLNSIVHTSLRPRAGSFGFVTPETSTCVERRCRQGLTLFDIPIDVDGNCRQR